MMRSVLFDPFLWIATGLAIGRALLSAWQDAGASGLGPWSALIAAGPVIALVIAAGRFRRPVESWVRSPMVSGAMVFFGLAYALDFSGVFKGAAPAMGISLALAGLFIVGVAHRFWVLSTPPVDARSHRGAEPPVA